MFSPRTCTRWQHFHALAALSRSVSEHCGKSLSHVGDEVLGEFERREMTPVFSCSPPDDVPVPFLGPGAWILLDVEGIHGDGRRHVDTQFWIQ